MIAIADPRSPGAIRLPGPCALPADPDPEPVSGFDSGWMGRVVGPFDRHGIRQTLLVCDLFCGAGGFTTGALRAIRQLGLDAVMAAVNHWPVAIATHRLNHPEVRHYIEDVRAANPADVVPERYLDVLLCSPSCVFFSRARGGRPNSDQKRMDPEAIIRWIDEIDVRILICENVPEFRKWCRIDPETERPMRGCEGELYDDWIRRIEARGYKVEWRILNCADYGDPTSRQRWFLIARKDGVPIEWPRQSHSKTGGVDAEGRPLARWRGAAEIIDWTDRGTSIFNRRPRRKGYRTPKGARKQLRALAFNTLRRVKAGTDRFTGPWRRAFAAAIEEEMELVLRDEAGLDRPSARRLVTFRWDAAEGAVQVDPADARVAFLPGELLDPAEPYGFLAPPDPAFDPWLVMLYGTGKVRSLARPAPTATAGGRNAGLSQSRVRLQGASTFTCANRTRNAPRSVADPVAPVLTGSGGSLWVANPAVGAYVLSQQSSGAPRAVREPIPAVATAGAISLAIPSHGALSSYLIAVNHGDGPSGNNGRRVRDLAAPLLALTATRGFALLDPVVRSGRPELQGYTAAFFGSNVGRRSATSSLTSPLRAVTTHGRYGFCLPTITPYLVPQFGERPGQAPRTHRIDVPAPAVTSHGAGALVVPMLVRIDNAGSGGCGVRGVGEPVWTQTGKAGCGVAESYIISPRHSRLGGGPAPRHVALPVPTLTGGGSQVGVVSARAERNQLSLLPNRSVGACPDLEFPLGASGGTPSLPSAPGRTIWVDGVIVQIDVAFRMLRNRELARSHSFDDEETTYEFVGTEAEQTRQVGNSVPVSTAKALVLSQICRIPGVLSIESAIAAKAHPQPVADQLPAAA